MIERILKEEFQDQPFELEDIAQFLKTNDKIRNAIYREKEKEFHLEQLKDELYDYNEFHETDVTFTDKEFELMLEQYEDALSDSLSDWRDITYNVIKEWCENV